MNAPVPGHQIFIPYGMGPVSDRLIVTEGIFDALKVYQATGVPTIALLGMTPAKYKFTRILELTNRRTRISLMFDEKGTYLTAMEYLKMLEPMRKVEIIKIKGAKDPGDMKRNEIRRIVQ
jgi:DNA primase